MGTCLNRLWLFWGPTRVTALAKTQLKSRERRWREKRKWRSGKIEIKTRKKFLAVDEECVAIVWLTPGFKGRTPQQNCVDYHRVWEQQAISTLCQILSLSSLCCMSLHALTVCVHDWPDLFELQRSVKLYTMSNVTETNRQHPLFDAAGWDLETVTGSDIPRGKLKKEQPFTTSRNVSAWTTGRF